jgi:uncharacterized protein YjbI with pentapeptide repeats
MTTDECVSLLSEGISAWNDWRSRSDAKPDLSGADLSGMDLGDANFTEVKFVYTN